MFENTRADEFTLNYNPNW